MILYTSKDETFFTDLCVGRCPQWPEVGKGLKMGYKQLWATGSECWEQTSAKSSVSLNHWAISSTKDTDFLYKRWLLLFSSKIRAKFLWINWHLISLLVLKLRSWLNISFSWWKYTDKLWCEEMRSGFGAAWWESAYISRHNVVGWFCFLFVF